MPLVFARGSEGLIRGAVLFWLASLCIVHLSPPIVESLHHYQRNYNEGWNVYRAGHLRSGQPLYGREPGLAPTNYPFFSFHLVSSLPAGSSLAAGRILSIAGLAGTAAGIGFIVILLTANRYAGVAAGLIFTAAFAHLAPAYVALNDPQAIAHAIVLGGIVLGLSRPDSYSRVSLAAILVCLGLFTKHNIAALPAAFMVWLLLTNRWRPALVFCSAGLAAAALLMGLSILLDGPYVIQHLLLSRTYSASKALSQTVDQLRRIKLVIFSGGFAALLLQSPASRKLAMPAMILSALAGVTSAGGAGVWVNAYFELLIASGIAAGLAIAEWDTRFVWGKLTPVAITAGLVLALPPAIRILIDTPGTARTRTVQHRQIRQYVASQPGPAICENLLVCHEAGKPLLYDVFAAGQIFRTGKQPEAEFLERLRAAEFGAVQLNDSSQVSDEFRRALGERYRIGASIGTATVFVPLS